jgi:serine/threonine protein kinase
MPVCSTCGTSYSSTVRICVRDGTPLVSGPKDHEYVGTLLDGKYRIDSFISAGGMGSVYRALHVMLDKPVAVKVIKNELVTSDEVVARFQREARAASTLNHPNIVSIYDLGQTPEGTLYIAMEFIDGPSLKQVIRRDGPLTPRQSIDILRQVASALSTSHRKQIVHRDLKSDNLMLMSDGDRQIVKLVDFGIAKTFDESTQLTAAGYMLGTPHYMSPEQAAGKPVDHRADLYSLGVILYETLTGLVPFGETSLTSMLLKLATEVPPPPSARRPDARVPPALDAVAMRCLEKDPEQRFQSANEFAEALDRASAEIDTVAAPEGSIAADKTLVRPAHAHTVATDARTVAAVPTVAPVPTLPGETVRSTSVPAEPQHIPAAHPRAGLTVGRMAVLLLVLVVIAGAVVGGILLMNNSQQESRPTATIQQPAAPTVQEPAAPAPVQQPPPAQTNIAPTPPVTAQPASIAAPPPPKVATPPRANAANDRTPPAATQTPAPAAAAAAPAPAPAPPTSASSTTQSTSSVPSVSVTCQASSDDCDVIRSEIVRALRDNQVTGDIEIAVKVAQTLVRPSTRFGAPSIVRTYSVELAGMSRGAAVAMPEKRSFEFDALDRSALQDHARQLASATVEAVRAFAAKGRN